ncbi:membrane protein [Nocardiopsis kunsanensis]|uniref:Membrane protein n=1 Tax=Nocardiopsis kunsanensis TaxID=141693 RepID=A0A918XHF6_9ACTN|nr:MHYT domain-containing protein [Nocardiopsis kunsanensis]GHD30903.1 membrane protein [Nocardiopsis kunsanensis]
MFDLYDQGWIIPALAYLVSVIGSYLGLSFAARARRSTGFSRWQWLGLAALTLGGVAVWSMHFIAMMGFSAPGAAIRYDTFLTVVSGITAVVVMGVALSLTLFENSVGRLLLSGTVAGLGVVTMHYTGMASMNTHGEMHHDLFWVTAATLIALVAATVALWCASRLDGQPAIIVAAVLMGAAVTLMHYTGMVGVHVGEPETTPHGNPEGVAAFDLLLPLIVGLFVFVLICSLFLLLGPDDDRHRPSERTVRHAPEEREVPGGDAFRPRHHRDGTRTEDLWPPQQGPRR